MSSLDIFCHSIFLDPLSSIRRKLDSLCAAMQVQAQPGCQGSGLGPSNLQRRSSPAALDCSSDQALYEVCEDLVATGLRRRVPGMASDEGHSIIDISLQAGAHLPGTGKAGC
jgi:hypothetical protein